MQKIDRFSELFEQQSDTASKKRPKHYQQPKIVIYGDIAELTKNTVNNPNRDDNPGGGQMKTG